MKYINTLVMKSLIFIFSIVQSVSSMGSVCDSDSTPIVLIGKYETHKDRSLIYPLEVYKEDDQLTITFFNATENVTITIIGSLGIVETRTVSFVDFQKESINIEKYTDGPYSISITTLNGLDLRGNFTALN